MIILLILAVMITIHEFGHFIAARICGIRVREFAIGMGPVIFRRPRKPKDLPKGEQPPAYDGTVFSLRAIPVGGFCDMGEDDESADPNHFRNKPLLSRIFVLVSGALMNIVLGLIIIFAINFAMVGGAVRNTEITALDSAFPYADQIMAGDRIVEVNGHAIWSYTDLNLYLARDADKPYTFTLRRGDATVVASGIERTLPGEGDGKLFGFTFGGYDEITPATVPGQSLVMAGDYVRIVWIGLSDLVTGAVSVNQMMGPVGMGSAVNQIVTEEGRTAKERVIEIANLAALIAINLAVFNLLPIPALDGGRVVFLLISAFLILVRKRPLSPKIEGYIHGVTMMLLFGLMIFVFFNDIRRLVGF